MMTSAAFAISRCASCPISSSVACRSRGTGGHGEAQPRDLGDVLRQVARALQVGAHPQGGDDYPQVGGDRLLPGQQV